MYILGDQESLLLTSQTLVGTRPTSISFGEIMSSSTATKEPTIFTETGLDIEVQEIKVTESDFQTLSPNLTGFYTKNFNLNKNTVLDLTVTGIPASSKYLFATPRERSADGRPNNGDAMFTLLSAALSADGTKARIRFKHNWNGILACGVSMIFGK